MAMQCPTCASEQVQSVPMAYASGVSSVSGYVAGVGASGGRMGGGGGLTHGTQQTRLSQQLTPPHRKLWQGPFAIMFAGVMLLFATGIGWKLAGLAIIVIGGWRMRALRRYNRIELPRLHQQWESTFLCHTCGALFNPAAPQPTAQPT